MKKMFKVIFGVIVVLVVLVLIAALTLPLTINPIVKTAASTGGPKALGVPVSVGNVALSPLAGRLTISQLSVGNPKGYSDKPAFAVEKVDVELDIFSLMSDTIIVRKIQVDAPAISYETKEGASNFDTIQTNAKKSSAGEKSPEPADKKSGKKVIIEIFTLNGAQLSYASALTLGQAVTLPLPSVTVRDIGKASGGTSFADAVTQIINEIVGSIGQAIKAVAGQASEALKGAADVATDTAKDTANMATDTAKGAANTASDAAKSVTGAAADATKGAKDAATDAAKGIKDIFK